MTVWVVLIEWNRPPSEMTGDPGLVGVYATEALAHAAADRERERLHAEGHEVYLYPDPDGLDDGWDVDVHIRAAEVEGVA